MPRRLTRTLTVLLALPVLPVSVASANELYLNELFFDPPGSNGDRLNEYVELRGTPGLSLDNHYLLFLENEGPSSPTSTANSGELEAFFDLTGKSIGSNGFLTLRQADFAFTGFPTSPNPYDTEIAPGTADFKQDVVPGEGVFIGWGSTDRPSTIGWNSDGRVIENSGFSALLIRADQAPNPAFGQPEEPEFLPPVAPVLNADLDTGNDGLDELPQGWSILDGIGVAGESDEAQFGRLYAPVNFGVAPPGSTGNVEPGAIFIPVDFEIEYVARLGDSTGQTGDDWWVGNLTSDPRRPGTNLDGSAPNFRLSAFDTDAGDQTGRVEASTDQFEYGTIVTSTLGSTNLGVAATIDGLVGDYDNSGQVEQGDLNLVLNNWGGPRTFLDPSGLAFTDDAVNQEELNRVLNNWGSSATPDLTGINVPEPAAATVALGLALSLGRCRRSHNAHLRTTLRS
ncbi:MAG: hypothetical protein AAF328_05580 [Planctomycetota bacterium]